MLVRTRCAMLLVGALAPSVAWAQPAAPAPTAAQLARAKKAFADGKRLHDAGKLTDAIEKFKASYALSNNPLLLYNIALTMEELGADNLDLALVFYRRFLAEAPADATQRADATDRIAAITRTLAPPAAPSNGAPVNGTPSSATSANGTPSDATSAAVASGAVVHGATASAAAEPPQVARTYGAADFTHHAVETAPPRTPLDVTAVVPEDAGFAVTLWFRGAGEAGFASTPMHARGGELVGRIPAARMTGSAIQYYLEVRDVHGAVLTRAGKPTSPNVIALDAAAPPRFYADVADGPITPAPVAPAAHPDAEDPMARAAAGGGDGGGSADAWTYARWGTTGLAGVSIGLGITFYVLAHGHATALENDTRVCGTPPCQAYDDFDRDLQRTGKLEQTVANVALFGGVAVAAVAGYLWFRELTAHAAPGSTTAARRAPGATWVIAPALGAGGYTGAAAAVRF